MKIRTEIQYECALKLIESLLNAEPDSREEELLILITDLVEVYEDEHYPIYLK